MQLAMERLLLTASLHETQEERERLLLAPQRVCEQRHALIEFVRDEPVTFLCFFVGVSPALLEDELWAKSIKRAMQRQMLNQCGTNLCKTLSDHQKLR